MARVTLNIAKSYNNGFIEEIERTKYFQLQKNVATRADLYSFAIAVALMENKEPLPLSEIGNVTSFVRTEYMTNYEPLLSALYFEKHLKDSPEKIDDICKRDEVYNMAEEYANAGFGVIKEWTENIGEDTLFLKLITYMDKEYERIKDEVNSML